MKRPICQTLKQLRTERGMTQEAVAGQLHVTRQAISSYESGRTQPDLDTLRNLAEVYGVEIETILYGAPPADRALVWLKRTAVAASILFVLCMCIASFLLWASNCFFWMGDHLDGGSLSQEALAVFQVRERIGTGADLLQAIGKRGFEVGSLILAVLSALSRRPPAPKRKALWFGGTALAVHAVIGLWWALDPHKMDLWRYFLCAWLGLVTAGLLLVISLVVDVVRLRKATPAAEEGGTERRR